MSESSGASVFAFADTDEAPERARTFLDRCLVVLATGLGLFHYWSSWGGGFPFVHQRAIHMGGALAILLTGLAAHAHREGKPLQRAYALLALATSTSYFAYVFLNTRFVIDASVRATVLQCVWAVVVMLVGLDLARRVLGWMLPGLVLLVSSLILAGSMTGISRGWMATVLPYDMANTLGWTTNGIFGSITGISAGIVASFLVFGAMLGVSGGATSFLGLARFLVGRFKGGPGKVSLLTSMFFGTVSGSAVANVVVDGVFNIPLMKRSGFRPEFAAAVEATTSTGGQLVPPVMGAAAFILADLLGLPFTTVIAAAIVPMLLYYVGLFIAIHIEASKQGIPGIPKSELPKAREFLTAEFFGSFAMPMLTLVGVLFILDRSLLFASFCGTTVIVVYMLLSRRESVRARIQRVFLGFRRGGEDVARIAVMVLAAQILISVLGMSAFAARFANELAGFNVPTTLSLVFLMFVVVLLGFGVPTAAAYVLAASIVNPIFVALGIDLLAGHMFTLYIAVYANITPPIMPATYAAAAIAKADVMRSGFIGMRLLAPALLVPFAFALEPTILLTHGTLAQTAYGMVRMLVGMAAIAAGLAFWLGKPLPKWQGVVLAIGGAMLAFPGLETTLVGFVLMCIVILPLLASRRAERAVTKPDTGAGVITITEGGAVEGVRGEDWTALVSRIDLVLRHTDIPGLRLELASGDVLAVEEHPSRVVLAALDSAEKIGLAVVFVEPGASSEQGVVDLVVGRGSPQVALVHGLHANSWSRRGVAVMAPSELEIVATARTPQEHRGTAGSTAVVFVGHGGDGPSARSVKLATPLAQRWAASAQELGISRIDRVYLGVPLSNPMGYLAARATLAAEAAVVVPEAQPADAGALLAQLSAGDVTLLVGSRELLLDLVSAAKAGVESPARLGSVLCIDGPIAPEEHELVAEALGVVVTELFVPLPLTGTVIAGDELAERPGTVGRSWTKESPVVILGPDGAELSKGRGVVAFRASPGSEPAEWLADGSVRELADGGLLRTGFEGRLDEDGFLFLTRDGATPSSRPPMVRSSEV